MYFTKIEKYTNRTFPCFHILEKWLHENATIKDGGTTLKFLLAIWTQILLRHLNLRVLHLKVNILFSFWECVFISFCGNQTIIGLSRFWKILYYIFDQHYHEGCFLWSGCWPTVFWRVYCWIFLSLLKSGFIFRWWWRKADDFYRSVCLKLTHIWKSMKLIIPLEAFLDLPVHSALSSSECDGQTSHNSVSARLRRASGRKVVVVLLQDYLVDRVLAESSRRKHAMV